MGEREALLRAVCENPDDDLPRLVFADWLEEHGEPERAEFIRVEVELDRQPGYPDDYGPEYDRLSSKLIAYLNTWTWRRDLAIGGDVDVVWARGFADTLRCKTQEWLAGTIAVLSSHPLRKVEFRDTEENVYLELIHVPTRRIPWRLSFYRAIGEQVHSDVRWFLSRDKLVMACPEMTNAWLQDEYITFDDSDP